MNISNVVTYCSNIHDLSSMQLIIYADYHTVVGLGLYSDFVTLLHIVDLPLQFTLK